MEGCVHAALKPRSGLLSLKSACLMGTRQLLTQVGGWASALEEGAGGRERIEESCRKGHLSVWPATHLIIE